MYLLCIFIVERSGKLFVFIVFLVNERNINDVYCNIKGLVVVYIININLYRFCIGKNSCLLY